MGPAWHRQAIVFVLDEAPDQIIQGPQGIEFEFPKRIVRRTAPILETPGDRVHRLNEHPLFQPIGPNQLDEARRGQAKLQNPEAIGQDLFNILWIEGYQVRQDPVEIGSG